MILPSTRQLQYFVRIADLGSYRRAAAEFGMSQPPLTQQMQALEHRLGVALFDRSARRVRLTAAGEAFLGEARSLLSHLEASCREAAAVDRGEVGTIRLGLTDDFMSSSAVAQMLAFAGAVPAVRLEVELGLSTELIERLLLNEVDLVLAAPLRTRDPRIEHWMLTPSEIVLLVPGAHSFARRKRVSVPDLAGEAMIMMPEASQSPFAQLSRALFDQAGTVPRVAHVSSNAAFTVQLVAAGLGLGFATSGSLPPLPGGVHCVPLAGRKAMLQHAVFCRTERRSAVLNRLLSAVIGA